jgi:fucose permease
VIAGLCLIAALLWWSAELDERGSQPADPQASIGRRQMLMLIALPTTVAFLLSVFLYVLVEQSIGTWLPTFNNEILHLPSAMSIQLSSIFTASLAVGRLGASGLVARLGWLKLLLGCIVAMAALVLLTLPMTQGVAAAPIVSWSNAPIAAYVFPMIGMFMAPIYPIVCSVMLSSLPQERHASLVGMIVIFSALGGTIGSFLTGLIFQNLSGQTAFYLVLVPLTLLALALVRLHQRTQPIPAPVAA